MDLLIKIRDGHSLDAIAIGNVVEYCSTKRGEYIFVYKDSGMLWDITIKNVEYIEEVR